MIYLLQRFQVEKHHLLSSLADYEEKDEVLIKKMRISIIKMSRMFYNVPPKPDFIGVDLFSVYSVQESTSEIWTSASLAD